MDGDPSYALEYDFDPYDRPVSNSAPWKDQGSYIQVSNTRQYATTADGDTIHNVLASGTDFEASQVLTRRYFDNRRKTTSAEFQGG